MSTPQKPAFRAPERAPFKAKEAPPVASSPKPQSPLQEAPAVKSEWKAIATAPQEADARFRVRATTLGKDGKVVPVSGTEIIVRYRQTRKMTKKGHWEPSLAIIDDVLCTKLGFRPTEWAPLAEWQCQECKAWVSTRYLRHEHQKPDGDNVVISSYVRKANDPVREAVVSADA